MAVGATVVVVAFAAVGEAVVVVVAARDQYKAKEMGVVRAKDSVSTLRR